MQVLRRFRLTVLALLLPTPESSFGCRTCYVLCSVDLNAIAPGGRQRNKRSTL